MAVASETILAAFQESKVIPVFYHDDADTCCEALQACYDAGIRVFEFTNRGEHARHNFAIMRDKKLKTMPDLYLGIGTIKNAAEAKVFTDMGADFIVSPVINPAIADYCNGAEIFWVPGCMTPTEIALAEEKGAKLVKLFPGSSLGPGFVKAISPLFPNLKFMPTGGVEPEAQNLKAWFDAGVVCVGMGSNLLPKKAVESRDWDTVKANIVQTFAFIRALA